MPWAQEVPGSNPGAPTKILRVNRSRPSPEKSKLLQVTFSGERLPLWKPLPTSRPEWPGCRCYYDAQGRRVREGGWEQLRLRAQWRGAGGVRRGREPGERVRLLGRAADGAPGRFRHRRGILLFCGPLGDAGWRRHRSVMSAKVGAPESRAAAACESIGVLRCISRALRHPRLAH